MHFKREGTKLILRVDSETNVERCMFLFSYPCADEATAEIFLRHFRKILAAQSETVKERFYNLGYKDGRQKKKKMW